MLGRLPAGVQVQHLAAMLREGSEALSDHIYRYIEHPSSAFAALNAAFMTDGAYIRLPNQAVIEDPIHLLFISTGENEALSSYPRIFIVAGADTRLQLVESYCSVGETHHLTNTLTEIVAEERACISPRLICLFTIRTRRLIVSSRPLERPGGY